MDVSTVSLNMIELAVVRVCIIGDLVGDLVVEVGFGPLWRLRRPVEVPP